MKDSWLKTVFWAAICAVIGGLIKQATLLGRVACQLEHKPYVTEYYMFRGCKILYRGYWYSPEELQRKLDKQAEVQS